MLPLLLAAVATALPTAAVHADDRGVEFFEKHIRPVLVKHCYECHSADADDVKGGLRLDTREAIRQGGDSGAALVPKKPGKSLLLEAIQYKDLEMPPDGKLPDDVIADFRKWIAMGAPDPRDDTVSDAPQAEDDGDSGKLWSLQPIGDPEPPQVDNAGWPASDIDRFVLARLEEEGLQPVRDAKPLPLLRRVHFDLIGLPPSPETMAGFRADPSAEAYARLVDRLLDSPQFGERWARHWLDAARYAESNGKSRDVLMPHAWRYRDYVIDAYNADLPYDRFITEQIAGDLLPADSPAERDRQRIATGFLALGSKTLVGGTKQMDLIDEQINALGKAVLGLTTGCARCHDHKFDPIPTRDYYALAGIFLSTETLYGGGLRGPDDPAGKADELFVLGENVEQRVSRVKQRQKQLKQLDKREKSLSKKRKPLRKKLPKDWQKRLKALRAGPAVAAQPSGSDSPGGLSKQDKVVLEYAVLVEEIREVKEKQEALKKQDVPDLDFAVGVREAKKIRDCALRIGGEVGNKGDEVPRGFLSCVNLDDPPQIKKDRSGRLALARWLTHPDNPLTPRVAVNRVWLHLFGRGIVDTVDNFGVNGQKPTHPELLDYLARRFLENGWSTKALIREIVLSRTYRLSTEYNAENYRADPSNRLYWRMRRRRLEAEALRDAMLAASGRLDLQRPHASAVAEIGDGEVGRGINTKLLHKPFPHRSVYLPIIRGIVPEALKIFDFPEPSNVQGQRVNTNVPAQSLYLMNNPFVIKQAEAMAELVLQAESDERSRIELAYQLAVSRYPEDSELRRAKEFLNRYNQRLAGGDGEAAAKDREAESWTTFCHALLAGAEFRYLE